MLHSHGLYPRGSACFCADDIQLALDTLEAIKARHADEGEAVLRRLGFDPDIVLEGVGSVVCNVEATCKRMGIPIDEAAQTVFVDGLMMGALLAAIAPVNHAAAAIGGRPPLNQTEDRG